MTTSQEKTIRTIVVIDENAPGSVCVERMDGDRFVLTMQEAVNACGAFTKQHETSRQFEHLYEKLRAWCDARIEKIKSAHLAIRDLGLVFVVVQKEIAFDQDLCDQLVELDLEIADDQSLNLIQLDVLAIPGASKSAVSAFASSGSLV